MVATIAEIYAKTQCPNVKEGEISDQEILAQRMGFVLDAVITLGLFTLSYLSVAQRFSAITTTGLNFAITNYVLISTIIIVSCGIIIVSCGDCILTSSSP